MPDSSKKKKATPKLPANPKPLLRNPEQTRAKLLQATIDLLVEKGPDALSLKEVASLAGVSRAMTYKVFADKEHLLREAKAWMLDKLLESVRDIPAATQQGYVTQVAAESVRTAAKLVLNNRNAAKLLITDIFAGKALDTEHPLYKLLVRDLRAFKESGLARWDFDIEILSFIMLGSISTLIMLSCLPDAAGAESLAERYTLEWSKLLGGGLIAAPSKSRPKSKVAPKSQAIRPPRPAAKVKATSARTKEKIKKS
jgi:AcrR family transcriptional regulator